MDRLPIRSIDLDTPAEKERVAVFLREGFDLGFDADTEETLVMEEAGRILATASYSGNVIKQVAVSEALRGRGLAVPLLEAVIQRLVARRRLHLFVFTKPGNTEIFTSMGFRKVAGLLGEAVLLEWGAGGIEAFKTDLARLRDPRAQKAAALVMNCNPFTRGHRYLAEAASRAADRVYLFVVEADRSAFPFRDRLELVRRGVGDLPGVTVLPGGPYIISQATFPAYFTHEKDRMRVQAELDAELFAEHIAPALGIKTRYVGTEPFCPVTRAYNEALEKILTLSGMDLVKIPRLEMEGGPVSASAVREALRNGDWGAVEALVPETTRVFLESKAAEGIIKTLKQTPSRH